MTKEELRGQMRAMRAELTGDKREAAEQQAVDHMMAFFTSEEASPVLSLCSAVQRSIHFSYCRECGKNCRK